LPAAGWNCSRAQDTFPTLTNLNGSPRCWAPSWRAERTNPGPIERVETGTVSCQAHDLRSEAGIHPLFVDAQDATQPIAVMGDPILRGILVISSPHRVRRRSVLGQLQSTTIAGISPGRGSEPFVVNGIQRRGDGSVSTSLLQCSYRSERSSARQSAQSPQNSHSCPQRGPLRRPGSGPRRTATGASRRPTSWTGIGARAPVAR
jgi:hypothetical protein